MRKKIIKSWSSFLNDNLYRDYRRQDYTKLKCGFITIKKNVFINSKSNYDGEKILNTLVNQSKRAGVIYYELSHFNTFNDFKNYNEHDRFLDRILFDFDTEDQTLRDIKEQMSNITEANKIANYVKTTKELERELKPLQKEFRDRITNTDVLEQTLKEVRVLNEYFDTKGIKLLNLFSSGKGIHSYCFFDKISMDSYYHKKSIINNTVELITEDLIKGFNFTTLDTAPSKNITKGLSRLIYSRHEATNLQVRPINIYDDIGDIITSIKRNRVYTEIPFNEYAAANTGMLDIIKNYNKLTLKQFKLEEQKVAAEKYNPKKWKNGKYTPTAKGDGIINDMRVICKLLIPKKFVNDYQHYHKYNCIFCNSSDGSVMVNNDYYNCKHNHCTKNTVKEFDFDKLNKWNFIIKYYGLNHGDYKTAGKILKQITYNYQHNEPVNKGITTTNKN